MKDVEGYDLIVLPQCSTLTENQAQVIENFAKQGKNVLIFGEAASNLPGWLEKMEKIEGVAYCMNDSYKPKALAEFDDAFKNVYKDLWKVVVDNDSIGLQTHSIENGLAIHLVNYDYSKEEDAVRPLNELNIKVHMMGDKFRNAKIHTLDGENLKFESWVEGGIMNVRIHDLPLYAVVELTE
jgi:hypothetical protein